jgi:hypothetical protein
MSTIRFGSLADGSTRAAGGGELRLTIICFDVPLGPEMVPWPLATELHLLILLPIGNIYKDEKYHRGYEEPLSTVQRVIMPKEDVGRVYYRCQSPTGRFQEHGGVRRRGKRKRRLI